MNITLLENSHSFLEEALEKAVLAEKSLYNGNLQFSV